MPIRIKRYANRKLYNTETSRYITLKGIATLLEDGQEVEVIDNATGEDITGVTLSQILVDTERSNREVPGNLLSEIFQRGGDVVYNAIRRGVGDASDGLEELQRNFRKFSQGQNSDLSNWVACSPKDLERVLQQSLEKVFRILDLPRRSDIERLNEQLSDLAKKIGELEKPSTKEGSSKTASETTSRNKNRSS
jgi:polyhydroxyalkanoate synthesis repressor PhaR